MASKTLMVSFSDWCSIDSIAKVVKALDLKVPTLDRVTARWVD